ncbi:uncharacterized protein LOC113771242 [Coffea eugenioides]|uniref:uncharacterized protein LOC113771242 n=1 Tax=Coffea eugenioides TaxID=49369 RepID=UPI000F607745|nr:uncharacterized protein LOC113771242 [Coffea eugenioides]
MLTYRKSDELEIIGYIDSDYAGCKDTMKSTSGYVYLLAGGVISWKSAKQSLIASFTMAAEFITCYEASNQGIWLRNFITELRVVDGFERPLKLFCDNKSAVLYSNNNRSSTKSKHIDIKFLAVKERVQNGQLSIEHIGTNSMVADPLTKGLPPKLFHEHTTHMGVVLLNDDQLVRKGSPTGNFSVSVALEELRQKSNGSQISKYIWSSALPKKLSFFVWRLVLLLRKGSGNRGTSIWVWASGLFYLGSFWQTIRDFEEGVPRDFPLLMSWFLSHRMVNENHIRVIIPMVALWFIWRARNHTRFEGSRMSAESIIWQVGNLIEQLGDSQKLGRLFRGDGDCVWARGRRAAAVRRPYLVAWVKPLAHYLKLNTDASVTATGAFGGGVVRSNEGKMIFAFYKEFGEASVVHAEALALLAGLTYCQERHLTGVRVESDSEALVRMVASEALACWPLCNALRRIRSILTNLEATLSHVYRQANMVADAIASAHLGHDVLYNEEASLPRRIKVLLGLDRLGVPYIRH